VNARVQLYLGAFTTAVFLGVGVLLLVEQRTTLGVLVLILGVVRGILAFRQARSRG
jgi:hypothetical protein